MLEKVIKSFDSNLDVRSFLSSNASMNILVQLLFNKHQRLLFQWQRQRAFEEVSSTAFSDDADDGAEPQQEASQANEVLLPQTDFKTLL